MNFALLGDDPAVLPLVRAIAANSEHTLRHAAVLEQTRRAVVELVPAVKVHSDWAPLLTDGPVDAVIVAGARSDVLEGARQLASAGTAVLLLPSADQGSAFLYELALIRDETQALLLPLFPRRAHPLRAAARERIAAGPVGRLLHLQLERALERRGSPALLSDEDVRRSLLPDVELLRDIGGAYDRITALHSGRTAAGLALASVTLAGDGLPEAHWRLRGEPSPERWKLVVTGERGTLELAGGSELSDMTLRTSDGELTTDRATAVFETGDALVEQIEAAIAGEPVRPDWNDLTQCVETVEAAQRSVTRRRTIDLHFEPASERSQFKTQMTAIGCLLLLLTPVGVVVLMLAGAAMNINPQVMKIARIAVFVPLFLFLALQLLIVLARPSASRAPAESNESEP